MERGDRARIEKKKKRKRKKTSKTPKHVSKKKIFAKNAIKELKKKIKTEGQHKKQLQKFSREIKLKFLKKKKFRSVKNISKELKKKIKDAKQTKKSLQNHLKEIKKPITKTNKIIAFSFIVILLVSTGFLFYTHPSFFQKLKITGMPIAEGEPGLGTLTIQNIGKEWVVTKATGEESQLTFWTANAKDKKTELGWVPSNNNCAGWTDKYLYYENGGRIKDDKNKDISLKCESSKCDGNNCYHISLTDAQSVNIHEYVQLGESSVVYEYQDTNLLNYQLDFAEVNITLYKNISNNYDNTINDIYVFYNQDDAFYKFGVNDSSLAENETAEFKYEIKSSVPIIENGWKPYITNTNIKEKDGRHYYEHHEFDLSDICNRQFEPYNVTNPETNETYTEYNKSADCNFNYYNATEGNTTFYYLEITLISDKNIDPSIGITIEIIKAEHLDENRQFISDIYDEVKELDDIWSETIPADDYVRVVFEKNLTSDNDITVYPRITSGEPRIEVYEVNRTEKIAEFTSLNDNEYNKVLLNQLGWQGSQDTFDLRVLDGSIEIEHVIDPIATYDYNSGQGTLHFIYESPNSGGTFPPLWTDGWGGTQISPYTNVQSDNIQYITQLGGSNTEPYFRFNFTISESPSSINSIFIHINGFSTYDGGEDADCFVANFNTQAWDKICDIPTSDGDCDFNITSSVTNYIQGNQLVYLCFGKNLDSADELSIDYTNVTVYTTAADTTYPQFSNYWDNNASLVDSGTGKFNVTVTSTNGTVLLEINNVNVTAKNLTANVYNASYEFSSAGTYAYRWHSWGNGTSENYNKSVERSYTVNTTDTTKPDINITYPINNTNWSNVNLDVNYTRSDDVALFNCWYSNDTYLVNISLGTTCDNITSVVWSEAKHNVTVWANDTTGNYNFSTISFTIDTVKPDINITYPLNNSQISDTATDVNYTRADFGSGLFNCWYSNDTYLVNTTLASCENVTTIIWTAESHNVTVWANDSAGNFNWSSVNFSISASNPPKITYVFNESMTNVSGGLNAGPLSTGIEINFTAYDADGNLNISTALINFSKSGETTRENASCYRYEGDTTNANFTCEVTMWWWDDSGTWSIDASISDNSSNYINNASTVFQVGETTGFEISPSLLTWPDVVPGSSNTTSTNDPLVLNNTGNKNISANTIQINATNLLGETDNNYGLWTGNFSMSWNTSGDASPNVECAGSQMNITTGNYANITLANLTRGNYTIGDGSTGQEQLYVCLRYAGSELIEQPYSTSTNGAWTIRILLVALIPKSKKKKKKQKNREKQIEKLEDDKLIETISLLTDELKDKYRLNKSEIMNLVIKKLRKKYKINRADIMELSEVKKISIPITIFSKQLGALESLVKYMKENLNMNYHEIAKELKRNERTIWSAYKKAKEKQPETIKIKETATLLPISIFENKSLTVLETVIIYLKEKGMKFSEIGEMLNRDQRNIWTIYIRTINKKKRNI